LTKRPEGAAVYSQAIRLCPPRFALRLRLTQPALKPIAQRTEYRPEDGGGQRRNLLKNLKITKKNQSPSSSSSARAGTT
jgi:hypothetical protein